MSSRARQSKRPLSPVQENDPKVIQINDGLFTLELEPDFYAEKDGVKYPVWVTKMQFVFGGVLGRAMFVLDEKTKTVIAEAFPMCNMTNGFELVKKEKQ